MLCQASNDDRKNLLDHLLPVAKHSYMYDASMLFAPQKLVTREKLVTDQMNVREGTMVNILALREDKVSLQNLIRSRT